MRAVGACPNENNPNHGREPGLPIDVLRSLIVAAHRQPRTRTHARMIRYIRVDIERLRIEA